MDSGRDGALAKCDLPESLSRVDVEPLSLFNKQKVDLKTYKKSISCETRGKLIDYEFHRWKKRS